MHPNISELIRLMPPRAGVHEEIDWSAVSDRWGHEFPADYREFMSLYGGGAINNSFNIAVPLEVSGGGWLPQNCENLSEEGLYLVEDADLEDSPEFPGSIAWAMDCSAGYAYWDTVTQTPTSGLSWFSSAMENSRTTIAECRNFSSPYLGVEASRRPWRFFLLSGQYFWTGRRSGNSGTTGLTPGPTCRMTEWILLPRSKGTMNTRDRCSIIAPPLILLLGVPAAVGVGGGGAGKVPEGDSVFRAAAQLRAALAGRPLLRAELRLPAHATADLTGRRVESVVPRGKHLLTRFEGGLTLHTHLRMDGRWQVVAPGERWSGGPAHQIRGVLANADRVVLGYRLPVVELLPTADEERVVQSGRCWSACGIER